MESTKELSKFQLAVMSVAAGLSVANIYYNQPILSYIAKDLHIPEAQAGSISMLSQIGYGLGLFFVVPLGDKISKRKLTVGLLLLLSVHLFLLFFAKNFLFVQILSLCIGILSVSPQVLIPLAAGINKNSRGKTVGTVLSGLLIGILAARVLSGHIADWIGWRWIYIFSGIANAGMAWLLYKILPEVPIDFSGNYGELLQSTLIQLKRFQTLRSAALLGALLFGIFCAFWTTITFHLSAAPFNYSAEEIGNFGLAAIAGALAAPIIGKLSDKGKSQLALTIATGLVLLSMLLIMIFPHYIPAFILSILLLDLGIQGAQVTNAARIYGLDINSSSRINTVYMTAYFLGGSCGTGIGLWSWAHGGWTTVTIQLLLFAVAAIGIVCLYRKRK